jgi:hypothetical protein
MRSTIESALQATLLLSTVLVTGCVTEDAGASDDDEHVGIAESALTDSLGIGTFFQNRQNKPPLSWGRGAGTNPVCPAGYTEILGNCVSWTDSFPASCPSGKEMDDGLCYQPCPLGYDGVGPVCWLDTIGTEACDALYSPVLAASAKIAHRTRTYGIGAGLALGASVSTEAGVYYGENGEYGCYTSVCYGAVTNIGLEVYASFGDFTGVAALTGDGFDLSLGVGYGVIGYTQSLSFDGGGNVVGFVQQGSLGLGLSPIAIGVSSCDATLTQRRGPLALAVGDDMNTNEMLTPGHAIWSSNGQYRLVYQTDGNLVLYRTSNGAALWALPISSPYAPGNAIMQTDGNLVVYAANGGVVWASNTSGSGHRLVVQNDGNVVMYRPNGTSVWSTNTMQYPSGPAATGFDMYPGETLSPGHSLFSSNGQYRLSYQTDGNLVLYRTSDNAVRWATHTHGTVPGVLIMQSDGNLVLYRGTGGAIWSSSTNTGGSHLDVQSDGNLVVYRPNGTPAWALW